MPRRALTAIACLAALATLLPAGASATIAEVGAIQPTAPPSVPSCTAGPMGAVGLAMEREKTEEEEAKAREQKEKEKKEREAKAKKEKKERESKARAKHKGKGKKGRAKKHKATGHKASAGSGRRRARKAAFSHRRLRASRRDEHSVFGRAAAAAQTAPSTTTTTTTTTGVEEGKTKSGEVPAKTTGEEAAGAEEAPCLAVSRTTGLQVRVGTMAEPLVIPKNGRIVAWTLQLGRPTPAQIKFFNANEGGQAEAGIAILQPKKHPASTYKLIAQSQVLKVEAFFGLTAQFPLSRTIKVKKGDLVALTVPTWVPALALGFGKETSWLSSRQKGQCSVTNAQTAQTELKSLVQYSCSYQTARLTYSATLISTP